MTAPPPPSPVTPPVTPPPPPVVAAADLRKEKEWDDDDDPFNPGPIDPEKETDLFPPDLHRVWQEVRREAEKAGDVQMLTKLQTCGVYPVIYDVNQQLCWEVLNFTVVKELRRGVLEFGLSSPYTTNLLGSIMRSYNL